jgi:hypothetical protein
LFVVRAGPKISGGHAARRAPWPRASAEDWGVARPAADRADNQGAGSRASLLLRVLAV